MVRVVVPGRGRVSGRGGTFGCWLFGSLRFVGCAWPMFWGCPGLYWGCPGLYWGWPKAPNAAAGAAAWPKVPNAAAGAAPWPNAEAGALGAELPPPMAGTAADAPS